MPVVEGTNDGIVIKGLFGHFEFGIDYDLHRERNYWLIYRKRSYGSSSFDSEQKMSSIFNKIVLGLYG